ncbi:MAG TPA: DUF790 family protein [Labilithrix sp.]|nr:DUF790 family protein [Labilithrix sp.]
MLTADLVDARRKDGQLLLRPLDREGRQEALALGNAILDAAHAFVGKRREELEEAWDAATNDAAAKRFKLAAGLRKLATDACSFEAEMTTEPAELRRLLFTRASEVRRTQEATEPFRREDVVEETAKMLGIAPDAVERAMFADLRSEHVLRSAPTLDASSLVEAWELGQAQAVLLTAVRITCEVFAGSPGLVRELFAKLKFHKLLFSAERIAASADSAAEGWRLVIDGPYSMFDAVTKYGLRLALAFPALRSLERWSLTADIRWGKTREPLVFRLSSGPSPAPARSEPAKRTRRKSTNAPPPANVELHLSDEVRELMDAINAQGGDWRARPSTVVLDVPGEGVCVPDLELTRTDASKPVYVEVLGYWSRDAVFRRVELAEKGLGAPTIFAVSSRLRVSAEVLDESVPSSLYVYKGKMSPRAIVTQASRLATSD